MTATVAGEALQVRVVVRSFDVPSVYVPDAVNCWDLPKSILGADGAMLIETRAAGVTVTVAVVDTEPDTAVMVVEPVVRDCASPAVPAETLIVATVGFDDIHCTDDVRFCVELSLYVPVATNGCVVPRGIEGVDGVTAIETSTALLTCTTREPVTLPSCALTVALPVAATAVTKPEALTTAVDAFEEVQVTPAVSVCVVASEYLPVATSCWVVPLAKVRGDGLKLIESSAAGLTARVVLPLTPPWVAVIVVVPCDRAVARPTVPVVMLMEATAGFEDDQLTVWVMS
jgi:hypothetical protein